MELTHPPDLAGRIGVMAQSLEPGETRYDGVLDLVGDAEVVLLGEATHGTRQFYEARAAITRRLIEEKGFTAVAVEGDWPDCYRVNRYVRGNGTDTGADVALGDFRRFPTWMWRNASVRDFVEWLRARNQARPPAAQAGFYGLDMYSLYRSIDAVLAYLARVDPDAEAAARSRYECFDAADGRRQRTEDRPLGIGPDCEDEVVAQLLELRQAGEDHVQAGVIDGEAHFAAVQNARVVKAAEAYYRQMYRSDQSSWNLRDGHMADTLDALKEHLSQAGQPARIVVWAHNSHVGDARATEFGRRGEHTLGQIVRERHGERACLIGFTTHRGTVTAASRWDGPAECKQVRPGLADSIEHLLHEARDADAFFLPLRGEGEHLRELDAARLERAIGVIYLPRSERASHYFHCRLPAQFDGILHFDETEALHPLDPTSEWERGQAETYPYGL